MKENLELERGDIRVHHDMEVDCDIGQQITAYIETWFDASRKFGSQAQLQDGEWLNMYAKYNPFEDTLRLECEICRESGSTWFDYTPTAAESRLFKDMITETIREVHKQTPQEFCRSVQQNVEPVFVYENRGRLSPEQIIQKGFRLKYHCEENNYLQSGSLSIRNSMKRVRKRDSIVILASQNIEDFLIPSIREFTKPLFSIPTHQFLFYPGQINPREYMEALQVEDAEYELIRYPERGTCLYRCGNERYLLQVIAPDYKAELFGKAGGR